MKKFYIFLIISIIFNVLANFTLKSFVATGNQTLFDLMKNIFFYFSIMFFGINFIFYAFALQSINISVAYPIVVGMSVILITIFSTIFLGEQIHAFQLIGVFFVIIGVFMIYRNNIL